MHEAMIFRVLIAMVLVAPLPLGAFPDWAWSVMAAVVGGLLLVWGVLAVAGRATIVRLPPRLWWSIAPFVAAMGWAVFQTLPVSPPSLHHPLWRDAAEVLGIPYAGSISLDPAASWEGIVRIASYAGIFWLALQYGRGRERAWLALRAVALGAACYALYGLAVDLSGSGTLLWWEKTVNRDVVTATFVNRNSFATFAGLGLLCTTAILHAHWQRARERTAGPRERLRRLIAEDFSRSGVYLGGWLVLSVALLLTESRGGIAATVLALLAFFASLAARRGVSARSLGLAAAALALAGTAVFDLGGEGLERRLWTAPSDWQIRSEHYAQTIRAIGDAPLLGTGLGTFAAVYRLYGSGHAGLPLHMAHNDWLELALELGVPAAAGFIFTLAALAFMCGIGLLVRRRNPALPATGFAASVLVGSHALVDFSLQIPAVAATFALVLGVATAQSWRGRSASGRSGRPA